MPRSTILYPTLVAEAVDQIVLLKDPIFGHERAEIALRPVKGRGLQCRMQHSCANWRREFEARVCGRLIGSLQKLTAGLDRRKDRGLFLLVHNKQLNVGRFLRGLSTDRRPSG